MSDPREFDHNPNLSRNGNVGRQSSGSGSSSVWIIAGVVAVVLLGLAAYSYRDAQITASDTPSTTSGQSTRPPVPTTPPAAPVAPAPPAASDAPAPPAASDAPAPRPQ
jgi:hypothetical protein